MKTTNTNNKQRFIIRVINDKRGDSGYITFEWRNGRRWPESYGVCDKAQSMTKLQAECFDYLLTNNEVEFEVVSMF